MTSRTTIQDVAERAGVSSATVSNVINGKEKVSERTRRKVTAAIEALNYRSDTSPQVVDAVARKSIGLVIQEIENPYFADVIMGAQGRANEEGYTCMVASSEGEWSAEIRAVDVFLKKELDGLIISPLLGGNSDLSHLFDLKRRNIPIVLLEDVFGLKSNFVVSDNFEGARRIATHLFELGHEDIIHFAGPESTKHSRERAGGFRQAFFDAERIYNSDYVIRAGTHLQGGYQTGMEYFGALSPDKWPTAVACYNDLVAIGLIHALQELDIAVPEEVSVAGFNDIKICRYAPLPLTSIKIPALEKGRAAVDMLTRNLEADEEINPKTVSIEPEINIRKSTAPPKVGCR